MKLLAMCCGSLQCFEVHVCVKVVHSALIIALLQTQQHSNNKPSSFIKLLQHSHSHSYIHHLS